MKDALVNIEYSPPDTISALVQQIVTHPKFRLTQRRKQLWLLVLYYIRASDMQCADISDKTFITFMNDFIRTSRKELSRQLRLMHQAGLLNRTFLKRSLTDDMLEVLFAKEDDDLPQGTWIDDPMPTCFYRYHLPGTNCPKHFNC